ncbi:MAG: hypothetical protein ABR970_13785 [Roseiarcus sp.]|jgi:hypothetical protein
MLVTVVGIGLSGWIWKGAGGEVGVTAGRPLGTILPEARQLENDRRQPILRRTRGLALRRKPQFEPTNGGAM